MASGKAWIAAARLRTLPLAFSSILMGAFLAIESKCFRWEVLSLTLLTTLFLQVLSNFANDFGDASHGVDDETRIGPMRAIQSGDITKEEMKKGMVLCSVLSFVCGCILLYICNLSALSFTIFLTLGLAAILAAIKYTSGKNPYGYRALGDLFVFLFFGMLGVLGSYFLHGAVVPSSAHVLPAAAIGFLSAAVLNLNNMRDSVPDKAAGKLTMAGILGFRSAKIYHSIVVNAALISLTAYSIITWSSPLQLTFFAVGMFLIVHLIRVLKCQEPVLLDPELKKVAISTLMITLLFGIGAAFF